MRQFRQWGGHQFALALSDNDKLLCSASNPHKIEKED